MNCLIVNVQEPVWKEMQRGFNTTTRDAVELLIRKGFSVYVFDKNLRAIHQNIRTVKQFHDCLHQIEQPEVIASKKKSR
jgi:uncharacterized protein YjcR